MAYPAGVLPLRPFVPLAVLSLLLSPALLRISGIEFVSESSLVSARQQSGPRWRAVGAGNVTARAADTGRGQSVDIRRGDITATVDADIAVAHVVPHDDDNVRPLLGSEEP